MGAANVIPGVSGGTIALITGIYERLITAIKQCGPGAIRLLLRGQWAAFWKHIDGQWLSILLAGVAASVISLAKLFEFLLAHYERYTMAFFFGLILLSILYVARQVTRWNLTALLSLLAGTVIAVSIALLAPASENDSSLYVFLCGVIAISSMILPGLSGSFILILMGNYALILSAVSTFSMGILIPMVLGCGFGLIAFSHILAWVFKRYADQTLALMTGFVVGSLVVIWPWKDAVTQIIERSGKEPREVVTGYRWFLPEAAEPGTLIAVALMALGAIAIVLMERLSGGDKKQTEEIALP